jgi:hypothetical protein
MNEPSRNLIDPDLLGEWEDAELHRQVFRAALDPTADPIMFFGTTVPYRLESGGSVLVINDETTYVRVTGTELDSLVGEWRDAAGGETLLYRADGRTVALMDGELITFFGTYSATADSLSSYDFRGWFLTDGARIDLRSHDGHRRTGTYVIAGDTLTLDLPEGTEVFTRVAPASPLQPLPRTEPTAR